LTVRIGIVDSGINGGHPHVGEVKGGVCIHRGGESPDFVDRIGHGTAVAAAIREKAPHAELYAIRIFERRLSATIDVLMRGFDWCLQYGMHVINLSVGTTNEEHRAVLEDLVNRARLKDVLVVSAAGMFPGKLDGVIAVESDVACPREACRMDRGVFFASPYPRPIPGVPPERNLNGVSFAIANCSGLLARLLESLPPHRAWVEFRDAASQYVSPSTVHRA
jgi:subtilisin family serine protease